MSFFLFPFDVEFCKLSTDDNIFVEPDPAISDIMSIDADREYIIPTTVIALFCAMFTAVGSPTIDAHGLLSPNEL